MILTLKDGREVELEVGGKYSDDIQVESAFYVDNGLEVIDSDVEYLQENYGDEFYEEWYEGKIGESDFFSCED